MSSRRYMVTHFPLEHFNGKLANTSVKCPNSSAGGVAPSGGFAYGFRRRSNYSQSRFGVRVMCRGLASNPYTAAEIAHKQLFATSSSVVKSAFAAPDKRAAIMADFRKQSECVTPRGYAISVVMSNNGVLPQAWDI